MATPASDVYSVGVVAFEMLTGELPFTAETPVGVAMRHIHDPASAPSKRGPDLPRGRRHRPAGPGQGSDPSLALRRRLGPGDDDWRAAAAAPAARGPGRAGADAKEPDAHRSWFIDRRRPGGLAMDRAWHAGPVAAQPVTVPAIYRRRGITGGSVEPTVNGESSWRRPFRTIAHRAGPRLLGQQTCRPLRPSPRREVVVPNLYGQTIGGAMSAILPLGLRITQDQPLYSSVPLNAVAAQDPPQGPLSPGTAIRVSLSRGPSTFPAADQP